MLRTLRPLARDKSQAIRFVNILGHEKLGLFGDFLERARVVKVARCSITTKQSTGNKADTDLFWDATSFGRSVSDGARPRKWLGVIGRLLPDQKPFLLLLVNFAGIQLRFGWGIIRLISLRLVFCFFGVGWLAC